MRADLNGFGMSLASKNVQDQNSNSNGISNTDSAGVPWSCINEEGTIIKEKV